MHVLVVDDDPIVLKCCERVLGGEGYEATLAAGAAEALEKLEEACYEMLLVDIKMPERDGLYLIERVKERCPGVPILVMSGYPTSETVSRSSALGAGAFIAKPFTPDELIKAVHKVMEGENR